MTMMNCIEFRRSIATNPTTQAEDVSQHVRDCQSCATFRHDQLDFEQHLRSAVNIDIPEGLQSRILLRQSTIVAQRDVYRRRLFALAASFILAITVIIGLQPQDSTQPVNEIVLKHIYDEPEHLYGNLHVKQAELNKVLAAIGINASNTLGLVNYAGGCAIRDKDKGAHIVLQGEKGPVTVLFMPNEAVAMRTRVQDERFNGVIVPADRGSYAIIGELGEPLEVIERRLSDVVSYVSWS